jgi:hypothetical protein
MISPKDMRIQAVLAFNDTLGPELNRVLNEQIKNFLKDAEKTVKKMPVVSVDVLIRTTPASTEFPSFGTLSPPFGTPDFECNALSMNKTAGIQVSLNNERDPVNHALTLVRVMDDIVRFRAVPHDDEIGAYRVVKMRKKNWSIIVNYTHIRQHEFSDDDVCIMCHETFSNGDCFKFKCFHNATTLGDTAMLTSSRCIMCRYSPLNLKRDLVFFQVIHELTDGLAQPRPPLQLLPPADWSASSSDDEAPPPAPPPVALERYPRLTRQEPGLWREEPPELGVPNDEMRVRSPPRLTRQQTGLRESGVFPNDPNDEQSVGDI